MVEGFERTRPHVNIGVIGGRKDRLSSQILLALSAGFAHDYYLASMKSAGMPIVVLDSGREELDLKEVFKDYIDQKKWAPQVPFSDDRFPFLYRKMGSELSDYICPDIIRSKGGAHIPTFDSDEKLDWDSIRNDVCFQSYVAEYS